jgi:glycosyltransferase involved in cell wall biosynthesis
MKKVLFIGPYRQNDGWGVGAKAYIEALRLCDIDLVIKPVYMSNNIDRNIPEELVELENKKFDDQPDIVIQNVLPNLLVKLPNCKNIGLFYIEHDNLEYTPWISSINQMDEVWVSTEFEIGVLKNSGVDIPINKVFMPNASPKINTKPMNVGSNDFLFYFIGEAIDRKNIGALVKAFHMEFSPSEPVSLLIKTSMGGLTPAEVRNNIDKNIAQIKEIMGLYNNVHNYKSELLITDRLDDQEMASLHIRGDCFVMPSRGESLNRPIMDALTYGNEVLCTEGTGMNEYSDAVMIGSYPQPVFTSTKPMKGIYTSRETWREIDIFELMDGMRSAYKHKDVEPDPGYVAYNEIKQFSPKLVSETMEKLI